MLIYIELNLGGVVTQIDYLKAFSCRFLQENTIKEDYLQEFAIFKINTISKMYFKHKLKLIYIFLISSNQKSPALDIIIASSSMCYLKH